MTSSFQTPSIAPQSGRPLRIMEGLLLAEHCENAGRLDRLLYARYQTTDFRLRIEAVDPLLPFGVKPLQRLLLKCNSRSRSHISFQSKSLV